MLSYTPQRPAGDPPLDDEWYTRGTIGLFLSNVVPSGSLAQLQYQRLVQALHGFLPINVRTVIRLTPRVDIEFVYAPDVDLVEQFADVYPEIEYYAGLDDAAAAALPDWGFLLSNTLGQVSADAADLTTLRRRSYFPPPG